jgi:DNA-binding NarL/FixJ family response regulator
MADMEYTIMVIDDHPIIHDGLKTLLASEKDMCIKTTATSASEALDKLGVSLPDVAIVDLSLGDADGTYLIQRMKNQYPKLKILVYTMSEEKLFAERLARAGADGYVMKTSPPTTLKDAIRAVLAGELFFTKETLRRFERKQNGRSVEPKSVIDTLSNREMDIFKLIGQGFETQTIAEKLNISRNTVDTHRINIKNKLEMPNGKALDRLAYEVIQQGKMP